MDQDLIALKLDYEAINWDIVHAIATKHLRDFTDFARAMATPPEPR
jgi:hypothetical protein